MNSFCSKNPALVILSLGGITLALYVLIGRFSPHVLNQWENTENIIRLMSHFRVEGKNIEEKYQTSWGELDSIKPMYLLYESWLAN